MGLNNREVFLKEAIPEESEGDLEKGGEECYSKQKEAFGYIHDGVKQHDVFKVLQG